MRRGVLASLLGVCIIVVLIVIATHWARRNHTSATDSAHYDPPCLASKIGLPCES